MPVPEGEADAETKLDALEQTAPQISSPAEDVDIKCNTAAKPSSPEHGVENGAVSDLHPHAAAEPSPDKALQLRPASQSAARQPAALKRTASQAQLPASKQLLTKAARQSSLGSQRPQQARQKVLPSQQAPPLRSVISTASAGKAQQAPPLRSVLLPPVMPKEDEADVADSVVQVHSPKLWYIQYSRVQTSTVSTIEYSKVSTVGYYRHRRFYRHIHRHIGYSQVCTVGYYRHVPF